MTTLKTIALFVLVSLISIPGISKNHDAQKTNKNKLWYTQPSEKWIDALPIGNGRLGGMVYGRVENEIIQLNEESVWAGPPIPENREGAWTSIEKARELIFNGEYIEAAEIMQKDVMSPRIAPRSYQTLGELKLNFALKGEAVDYRRELDLDRAMATTTFTIKKVTYTRQVFASPVDQVLVVVLTADKAKSISVDLKLDRLDDFKVANLGNNKLRMWGQASQKGKHLGVKYETQLMAIPEGGKMSAANGTISVSKANSLTIYLSAATDYNAADCYSPLKDNLTRKCSEQLIAVAQKSNEEVLEDHIKEHQSIFKRVEIDLGTTAAENLPTKERLDAVKKGANDPGLVALYFQYGRYLLLSSSRPGNLPANLQGIWNNSLNAPWNSDYHTNINMQMNYWPAEICNLSECHEPFFAYIESLVPSGQETAKEVYNCDGFVAHHASDVWHPTAPFGKVQYGMWPMGGAWCTRHFMEHYLFTGDTTFLAEHAYPILKESAKFMLDWLVINPRSGKLVSGPSTSPENKFYSPEATDKKQFVNLDMGNAMDQEIIWDNFTNVLEAAKILKIEDEFVAEVQAAMDNLSLPKIGSDGRLMEWSQEFEEVDAGHRHLSHLYGLHPGRQFSFNKTPYYIDAINRSISHRLSNGGGHTGWSRVWIINFYARLRNADKAYENVQALLQKSTANNLFDMHPPFQIDGNLGSAAGIAEMLVQSQNEDEAGTPIITLLPALPSAWPTGSVKGLCARGGFVVDVVWNQGELKAATFTSKNGGTCKIQIKDKMVDLTLKAGEKQTINNL